MNQHASMNRIYRLVWSAVREVWIPAAENTRGQGKRVSRTLAANTLAATTLALGSAYAQAAIPAGVPVGPAAGPLGGVIISGSGSIAQTGALTTITQASPRLSLTWNSFNIPAQDTVDFVQPSASAVAVNRILDVDGTQILGHLNANGQVYLINPNGIVFGRGAEVNVGGLVASTLALDAATVAGDAQSFSAAGAGSVINQGTIHAAPGGYVALLASHVGNGGVISAQLGSVALGAGSAATLTFKDTHLVSMQIDQSVLASVADNGGLIRADGGQVLMSAGAEKALLASVVNNTGVIEARTLDHRQGSIILRGGMVAGTVNVAGTLDASAPDGGNGGAIETSAAHVQIADSARVTTAAARGLIGSWLIDPTDFTISAGTRSQSASGIGASTLQSELVGSDVSIATSGGGIQNGDINVNAPVSWSSNTLTLTAAHNINVTAVMTVSGTAKVDFEPGISGTLLMGFASDGSFSGRVDISSTAANALTIGGQVYSVITNFGMAADATSAPMTATLQGIAAPANLGGFFALGSNIVASAASSSWNSGSGFTPIGNYSAPFTGGFDGLGHSISNLQLSQASGYEMALFGEISPAGVVRNVALIGASVIASTYGEYMGELAAKNYGVILNSSSTAGSVSGNYAMGGLVGANYGSVSDSHSGGTVLSPNLPGNSSYVGGLVGYNYGGVVTRSYSSAQLSGSGASDVGGLVGLSAGLGASIALSHATGNVSGANYVGGLAGSNGNNVNVSNIAQSYATGSVTGGRYTGGLAGQNNGSVASSFATGNVTGTLNVGGLVGSNMGPGMGSVTGSVNNSYAIGSVTGADVVGGLVGFNGGMIANSYSLGAVTAVGATYLGGLVGLNSATVSNSFYSSSSNPTLTGVNDGSGAAADVAGIAWGMNAANLQSQANFTSATPANGGVNPSWDFGPTWFMYEGHTTPLLQVFMSPLTVTAAVTQTYNASVFAPSVANLSYSVTPDTTHLLGSVTVSGSALGAEHVGTYSFTPGGLYSDQLGYIFTYSPGSLSITPAPLTVAGSTASKVYDGTTLAPVSDGTLVGVFGGDSVTLAQAGTFASKNAGSGIGVAVNDSLGGASNADYTLIEPLVTGSITPASLTVSGTVVGNKIYNGNTSAPLLDGSLSGIIPGDSVTLIQAGNFASASVGRGIAVTAADTLAGPSALNYSIIEPSGLSGTISPAASGNTPGTPGSSDGANSPVLAAYYASAQLDGNFIAPQWSDMPQVIDASPSIAVVESAMVPASTDAGVDQNSPTSDSGQGVVINVAMKIGATGTLKIEGGGVRLPITHVEGNP